MKNPIVRIIGTTFKLFDVTLPNALKQSHAHESDHLQSLSLYATWALGITALIYIRSAIDSEKKDSMVDKAIEAEARFVSLFNCEDRIYRAGEVGSVK